MERGPFEPPSFFNNPHEETFLYQMAMFQTASAPVVIIIIEVKA
jgi:hypothetical protein